MASWTVLGEGELQRQLGDCLIKDARQSIDV